MSIPKEDLVLGAAYHVEARNFSFAIWDGKEFQGLCFKFGQYFMDGEFHYDDGAPYGTVTPLEKLEPST